MGIATTIRRLLGATSPAGASAGRVLDVPTGYNVRELGGYPTSSGTTLRNRYLRSGGTEYLSAADVGHLLDYGVTHVLDLRGSFEHPARTCRLARVDGVEWLNVPLFDYDISDPALVAAIPADAQDNYLTTSYLTMLANRRAIRRVFRFFARANADGPTCTLFHCAAGMDRTGVTAMLLLGLVGADRPTIIADYTYSFGDVADVDAAVAAYLSEAGEGGDAVTGAWGTASAVTGEQAIRMQTIDATYSALIGTYGTVRDYLLACDVTAGELDAVARSLVGAPAC